MNRYEKVFFLPCLMLVCLTLFSGFGMENENDAVSSLLNRRTDLLQQACYGGISVKEAEKKLAEIEVQPLLAEDIQSLRNWDAGQLDLVKSMEFLSVSPVSRIYDYQTYRTVIRWNMRGMASDYQQTVEYYIVLKVSGDRYKLSEFTPLTSQPEEWGSENL